MASSGVARRLTRASAFALTLTLGVVLTAVMPSTATLANADEAPGRPGIPKVTALPGAIPVMVVPGSSGGVATSYTVTASPGGATCDLAAPAESCTIEGLAETGSFTVSVVAVNASGSSVPSGISQVVTPGGGNPVPQFEEVPANVFFTEATSMLKARGITTGFAQSSDFKPGGLVTRAEMAAFLHRMAGQPAVNACTFRDQAQIPVFAQAGACWLIANRITDNDPFNPGGLVTRAQMAAFLYRTGGTLGLWVASSQAIPSKRSVTVTGGYGSGFYRPGSTVHVWSSVSTTVGVAQRWSGDDELLAEPDEWHTSFVMPDRDVVLVANSSVQTVSLKVETFTGVTSVSKTVRYHFPPRMRGVVLFNHGTGGSSRFIEATESLPIAVALVADGYGVVSTEAEESAAGDLNGDGKLRWNTRATANNADLGNLQAMFQNFETRGLIPAGTPRFALGMSAGGSFSHFLGTVGATAVAPNFPQLRFAAVVAYCADATAARSGRLSTTPSAWYICGAEDNPEVSNTQARANEAAMRARGVPTDFVEHRPSPLYPDRFARIDGIDQPTSRAMAAELQAAGFVDSAGFITVDGDVIAATILANPAAFPTISSNPRANSIRSQVKTTRAEHSMYADYTRRTIDFFDRFNQNPAP